MIRKLHLHRACWMWRGPTMLPRAEFDRRAAAVKIENSRDNSPAVKTLGYCYGVFCHEHAIEARDELARPSHIFPGAIELSEILFQLSGIEPNIPDYRVHSEPPSSMSPKEGTGLRPSFEPWCKGIVGNKRMRRLFLSGAL